MAQLVEAIEGIAEGCEFFEAPITGGNVSLYNETLGEGIYPTPVLGIIGLMKTAIPAPVQFRGEGAEIVLLGGFGETDAETNAVRFGSSEYAKVVLNQLWGLPPRLDMEYEKRVHDAVREILAAGLAESAHDLSDGGLAVALSECCTPAIGAQVSISGMARPEFALFGESPSRILLTTLDSERVREIALFYRVECPAIGVTIKERLRIGNQNSMWIDLAASDLKQVFENGLPGLLSQPLTNVG
jgi:phosphoribosylformylglycinamidine synthase